MIDGLAVADLERRLDPLMGPLVWDLGHIAAYEDLWLVRRYGRRPLLRPDLDTVTTPSRRRAPCVGGSSC